MREVTDSRGLAARPEDVHLKVVLLIGGHGAEPGILGVCAAPIDNVGQRVQTIRMYSFWPIVI